MAKAKIVYTCQSCGARFPQWAGQCADCSAWNSLVDEPAPAAGNPRHARLSGYAAAGSVAVTRLADVHFEEVNRFLSGLSELDRVLGGGIVPGSVVLMGGD